jgi:hypothetical protein
LVMVPNRPLSFELFKDVFSTDDVHHNGEIWSILYKDFQVDFITTNNEEFSFCSNYFCQPADRANFSGKVAHILGLKFGHDGLWLPIRVNDSHKLGDVLLTRDPLEAEAFLDIKPLEKWDTFRDVFDNIVASKYFNPHTFALLNNTSISRVRDKKRPYYHKFLELCESLPPKKWFHRVNNKCIHLPLIFEAFPSAKVEFDSLWKIKNEADIIRGRFNGELVSQWTGYTGENLGKVMKDIKNNLSREQILMYNGSRVEYWVKNFVQGKSYV